MNARILLVDDSEADRYLLRCAVSDVAGADVAIDEADGADSALEQIGATDYDAIFLDIRMPGRDGFHVLDELRASKRSTWPIVFMWSSSAHPDDVARAYSSHASVYLHKAASLTSLRDVVSRCVAMMDIAQRPV